MLRYKLQEGGICDLEGFPLPECHDMLAMNELADPGDRIFTTNSYTFWLRADLIQCLSSADDRRALRSSVEDLSHLYDLGFRYVENVGEPWDLARIAHGMSVSGVYSRDSAGMSQAVQIYKIQSVDPDRQPLWSCRQENPPAWEVLAQKR